MTTNWNLNELRERVIANFPSNSKKPVELINSIGRSCEIFEYHKCLARDAFEAFSKENDPNGVKFFSHAFNCVEDDDSFWQARLVSEANLIACVGITRNSFDSFGQLLNNLVLPTPCTGNFYVYQVSEALPHGRLRNELKEALSSEWFKYLNAFINTAKHRQLITHSPSISFVDGNRGGKVVGFEYKNSRYPEYWAHEVLEGTVAVQNSLVSCGRLLNSLYLGEHA